jgi:hypothetical protein
MEGLGFDLRVDAHLRTLTEDVVNSSEIGREGLEPCPAAHPTMRVVAMRPVARGFRPGA